MKEKSYFDIEIDLEKLMERCSVDEAMYIKDLQQRKLTLNSDVDVTSMTELVHHILQYNKDDEGIEPDQRKPIIIYISSNGGSVPDGFSLIDAIRQSKTPVYTVNLSYAYSMGFLIAIAGHKRFTMQHATYLMHDGQNFAWDSSSKFQDQAEFNRKVNDRIKDYVLATTEITPELYDQQLRYEWYMFADEAKRLKVADYIIGEDCPLSEVI